MQRQEVGSDYNLTACGPLTGRIATIGAFKFKDET